MSMNKMINQCLFISSTLDKVMGAQLNRAILLNKRSGDISTKIIIKEYDRDFYKKIKNLEIVTGESLTNIFINMYDFFRNSEVPDTNLPKPVEWEHDNLDWFENAENMSNGYSKLGFKKGILKIKKIYDERNILKSIYFYNCKRQIDNIDEFDDEGFLYRRSIFVNNKVTFEHFFNRDGSLFLIKKRNFKDDSIPKFQLFDNEKHRIHEFYTTDKLWLYFLEQLIGETFSTFIAADRITDFHLVEKLPDDNLYKSYFIHDFENYSLEKFIKYLKVKSQYEYLSKPDAIVFSTHEELKENLDKYGQRNNMFFLPMLVPDKVVNTTLSKRESNSIVATFHNGNIVEAEILLRALRIVADKIPDVKLKIYGLNDEIRELVDELTLKLSLIGNVDIFKEHNIQENIYSLSECAVFVNHAENSELEMIDSLQSGCPIISFDYNFETNDIVEHGKNGYIVKHSSVNDLAEKVVLLLQSPNLQKISNYAKDNIDRYTELRYFEKWDEFLKTLMANKASRVKLKDIELHLQNFRWEKTRKIKAEVLLTAIGDMFSNTSPQAYIKLIKRKTGEAKQIIGDTKKVKEDKFQFNALIDFEHLDLTKGLWDIQLCFSWENSFIAKNIKQTNETLMPRLINNRLITPIFSENGNVKLHFKVGKYIVDQEELIGIENKIKTITKK